MTTILTNIDLTNVLTTNTLLITSIGIFSLGTYLGLSYLYSSFKSGVNACNSSPNSESVNESERISDLTNSTNKIIETATITEINDDSKSDSSSTITEGSQTTITQGTLGNQGTQDTQTASETINTTESSTQTAIEITNDMSTQTELDVVRSTQEIASQTDHELLVPLMNRIIEDAGFIETDALSVNEEIITKWLDKMPQIVDTNIIFQPSSPYTPIFQRLMENKRLLEEQNSLIKPNLTRIETSLETPIETPIIDNRI